MDKESIESLRSQVRSLQKRNNQLEHEIEALKRLRPGQMSRSEQRIVKKQEKDCKVCGSADTFEAFTPAGTKIICMTCREKKLGKQHVKDYK